MIRKLTFVYGLFAAAAFFAPLHAETLKLMFGTDKEPQLFHKFLDFEYVTEKSPYFEKGAKLTGWIYDPKVNPSYNLVKSAHKNGGSIPPDTLLEHGMSCWKAVMKIKVPNGKKLVHLYTGDFLQGKSRLIVQRIGHTQLDVNGKNVWNEVIDYKKMHEYWCRGKDYIYSSKDSFWDINVKPVLDETTVPVEVTDGYITINLNHVILTAMIIADDEASLEKAKMEVEKERRRMCDARYPWKPKKDEPLPEVDEISKKRGFLIFQKYGSDKVFPWSRPKKEELASALRVFAAQDEQEMLRFGIIPLRKLHNVSIEVGDFKTRDGKTIKIDGNIDIWRERYRAQGGEGHTGKIDSLTRLDPYSQVLQETTVATYEEGTPRMFLLDIHVPRKAESGDYFSSVRFKENGKLLGEIKLQLKVLPFALEYKSAAPYFFQFSCDTRLGAFIHRPLEEKKATWLRHMRFVAKYKFSQQHLASWEMQLPSLSFGKMVGENGKKQFTQTKEQAEFFDFLIGAMFKEGNAKFIQFMMTNWDLARFFGFNPGNGRTRTGKGFGKPGMSDAEYKALETDVATLFNALDKIVKEKKLEPFYFYLPGEADNAGEKGAIDNANYGKLIKTRTNAKTLTVTNGKYAAKYAPPYFDMLGANPATPITQELIDRVRSCGGKFYSHNTGQLRFQGGFQFWRMHGDGKFQETTFYQFFTPFCFLPWQNGTGNVYPTPDGGLCPSVDFLNYREGRDDYVYMWTLECAIKDAKAKGKGSDPAVKQAEDFVDFMNRKIALDPRTYHLSVMDKALGTADVKTDEWNHVSFERYRWMIANLIMKLKKI